MSSMLTPSGVRARGAGRRVEAKNTALPTTCRMDRF